MNVDSFAIFLLISDIIDLYSISQTYRKHFISLRFEYAFPELVVK